MMVKTTIYKIKFIDSCRLMRSKLSDLVDNLSEINNKNCKRCMERKNIKLECDFTGFKDNRLNYRCKDESRKSINGLTEKFPNVYQFCDAILINLFCYYEKVFILMSIWIAGKDLIKRHYQIKNVFTVN